MDTGRCPFSLRLLFTALIFFYACSNSLRARTADGIPLNGDFPGARSKYLEDFDFIIRTVDEKHPGLVSKKIDWERIASRFRPLFEECESDTEHVRNVMQLLATLRDGHSAVIRAGLDRKIFLPVREGLGGGGLWIVWDDGLLTVRGIMKGHPLEGTVPLGSVVAAINGVPAWVALERERRRFTMWRGYSSDHSLFASIGNSFFQFGSLQEMDVLFITPDLKSVTATLPRKGPGGKSFSFLRATLPEGVEWEKGAISAFLETAWCKKVGYLSITGSSDFFTAAAFNGALDRLEGLEVLLLDCRAMGGGDEKWARFMAGRFFPDGTDNGTAGRLKATGSWQFDGPIVMLQDELQVSSAETFALAMSETERVISVGRNTGGWSLVPDVFECPSGLMKFLLGIRNRPTPINGIYTEGIGWPPDIVIPHGPLFCSRPDPAREVGLGILEVLHAGASRKEAMKMFAALFEGNVVPFLEDDPPRAKGYESPKAEQLASLIKEDLEARLAVEAALLELGNFLPPDALGVACRLEDLAPRARAAGLEEPLERLERAVAAVEAERVAQDAFFAVTDTFLETDEASKKEFQARFGSTRTGTYIREHVWK